MTKKNEILAFLKASGFKHDPEFGFTLASGKKSDFYIDCKPAMLRSRIVMLLGQELFNDICMACIRDGEIVKPNLIAGVAVGGIPLATSVSIASTATQFKLDSIIVRKEPKGHGTGQLIESPTKLDEWSNVIIVEDVVTSGGSSLKTADAIRSTGANVLGVFAIVDRLEGGREALKDMNLYFSSLFTRRDFIED